jgi:UDP-N-acetylmuramoyl-tripeptide--D-alanyl-D-alanine ligase
MPSVARFRLRELADATGAVLVSGDPETGFTGVGTDTRALARGELFIALDGPNFRGNDFAAAAVRAGAAAVVLRARDDEEVRALGDGDDALRGPCPILWHPDPRRALGDFGAWHRSRLAASVIGVTGSCGKTTTKGILVQLLGQVMPTVGSPRSYNNDIGVPLTLCLADLDTRALVVEIGTNRPGEVAALCRIARPDAGVITNVGASHLEGLGSIEGVAQEKCDLARSLTSSGFLVLNADCRYAPLMRNETSARVITFSVDGDGDLNATDVWFHSGGTVFRLLGREVAFPLLGTHNVQNCLAALCVGVGLGVDLEELLPAIASLDGGRQRMERLDLDGLTVFDDSYNSNPDSARAAVRVLAGLHGHARRVLVLGDMLELGEHAERMHHDIGMEAVAAGIDCIIGIGGLARAAVEGAMRAGLPAASAFHLPDAARAADEIDDLLREGDVVLVKGSRGMALERLVARLRTRPALPANVLESRT